MRYTHIFIINDRRREVFIYMYILNCSLVMNERDKLLEDLLDI